ncbi:large conductance mechanosensitive channel protein MscL [Microbacterium sp.]|uniref:large conductance mechanosensitive channel protein MscL n=1 Tax=Microbacterium sp. TaxID=51671 RepID=UPI0039E71270
MLNGFKDFIMRGNVIDLAVAVVIGAAFTAIVDQAVTSIINPLIGLFFNADSLDTALVLTVPTLGGGTSSFAIGALLGAIVNFLAVAAVVYFVFVNPMNHAKAAAEAKKDAPAEEELPSEQELLMQIRDLLERERPQRS